MKLVDAQQARRVLDRLVGLPDLADPVEAGPARAVGRPRAVGRGAPDRRARARDRGVRPGRVLERRRPAHAAGRRAAPFTRPPHRGARGQARDRARQEGRPARRPRPTPRPTSSASERARLPRHEGRAEGAQALAGAAVHDVDAAAGGRPQARVRRAQDDDARPAPVRGHRPPRRGHGRTDHLHADRLGEHRRDRAARDRRAREDRVRRRVHARRAAPVQDRSRATPRRRTRRCRPTSVLRTPGSGWPAPSTATSSASTR